MLFQNYFRSKLLKLHFFLLSQKLAISVQKVNFPNFSIVNAKIIVVILVENDFLETICFLFYCDKIK